MAEKGGTEGQKADTEIGAVQTNRAKRTQTVRFRLGNNAAGASSSINEAPKAALDALVVNPSDQRMDTSK